MSTDDWVTARRAAINPGSLITTMTDLNLCSFIKIVDGRFYWPPPQRDGQARAESRGIVLACTAKMLNFSGEPRHVVYALFPKAVGWVLTERVMLDE